MKKRSYKEVVGIEEGTSKEDRGREKLHCKEKGKRK